MDTSSVRGEIMMDTSRYTRDAQFALKDLDKVTGLSDHQINALSTDPRTPYLNVDLLRMSLKIIDDQKYVEEGYFKEDPFYKELRDKFMAKRENPGEGIFEQRFKDSLWRYYMLLLGL